MKIVCIGGGPAGLYFAISMKIRDPSHDISVIERNGPDDTFGWGVVFSDQTMENLRANDPVSADRIFDNFAHWDDIDVHFKGQVITSTGHGFSGIARKRLLNILQARARELGIELTFDTEVTDLGPYAKADLVIACDGVNSAIRTKYAARFKPNIDQRHNRYIWLGTHRIFEAFTFMFEETPFGWIWAHAYRFDKDTSTFIVECADPVWRAAGLDRMNFEDGVTFCENLFAKYLDGHKLLNDAPHLGGAPWLNFRRVSCETWHFDNVVLMGDAAHTAHFSIGSGTKLAFEDAIALAQDLSNHADRESAFTVYEEARRLEVIKLQSAARNSTEWFENVPRYTRLEPIQFAYSLLTRSQRVSHENLRLRDSEWLEGVEKWFLEKTTGRPAKTPVRPMFAPFKLRDLGLINRIVVSPMSMYSADDGMPNDFHLVHLGTRAQGGAGLVFTEMTDVSTEGRITPGCAGLYKEEHIPAWKRIVDFVHRHTQAKIAIQLGHAGPKGATKRGWEGMDEPLNEGEWDLLAPSPVPWTPSNRVPREMTREDMERVKDQFVRAVEMAEACGFDMAELHCAHGYLLSAFITPLTNRRVDDYGGSLENRLRFPLEIFSAMRAAWPAHKPMSVRISATDWVEGGVSGHDAVEIARAFKAAGADIIDVSAGQTSTEAQPIYGRMFQTPFSDWIRSEALVPTIAVGNIYEADHVNSIIAAGRADLCALGRPHLYDPYWTIRQAAEFEYDGVPWPPQYLDGKQQLVRNLQRAAQMAALI